MLSENHEVHSTRNTHLLEIDNKANLSSLVSSDSFLFKDLASNQNSIIISMTQIPFSPETSLFTTTDSTTDLRYSF